jgi:Mlc titration factor MtfA (ptsG expression regulator)
VAQLPAGHVPLIGKLLARLRGRTPTLDLPTWQDATDALPWVAAMPAERRTRLKALAELFLSEKTITALGGLSLDDRARIQLAALCCLPLIEFGLSGLRGWSQLLVYPDAFRVQRSHVDAAGVLHEWEDELIGESWDSGPLILSWADIQADIAEPDAGFCVAVHEMAHKLDVLDGALDGTPPLPRPWHGQWARDFQQAFDAFRVRVDGGQETALDPYAAESPEEFFAVTSEYHWSDPVTLAREMPQVAAHLERLYGPSPMRSAQR